MFTSCLHCLETSKQSVWASRRLNLPHLSVLLIIFPPPKLLFAQLTDERSHGCPAKGRGRGGGIPSSPEISWGPGGQVAVLNDDRRTHQWPWPNGITNSTDPKKATESFSFHSEMMNLFLLSTLQLAVTKTNLSQWPCPSFQDSPMCWLPVSPSASPSVPSSAPASCLHCETVQCHACQLHIKNTACRRQK